MFLGVSLHNDSALEKDEGPQSTLTTKSVTSSISILFKNLSRICTLHINTQNSTIFSLVLFLSKDNDLLLMAAYRLAVLLKNANL